MTTEAEESKHWVSCKFCGCSDINEQIEGTHYWYCTNCHRTW